MKGTDRTLFYMVIFLSFLIGLFVFNESFNSYSWALKISDPLMPTISDPVYAQG